MHDLGPATTVRTPANSHLLPPQGNVPPAEARGRALKLIDDGYRALEMNDLERARHYALQAKALRPDMTWNERNPDRLLADIQRREGVAGAQPMVGTPNDARQWLKQARSLMQKDQFDEAEMLCARAAAVKSAGWRLFEDSPDRVRADLQEQRVRKNREHAAALMVEARKFFGAGNFEEAKIRAHQAHQLHGPYQWWEMGDRPQKLLDEIARAEGTGRRAPRLPDDAPQMVQQPGGQRPPLPPVNLVSATTQTQMRARAKTLILEARELERNGFLVEARAKAAEADALGVRFTAEEDNPQAVMGSLSSKCNQRIGQLLQQATEYVQNNPNDVTRFQKAEVNIHNARKLAESFGLDQRLINDRAQWLQQVARNAGLRPISATDQGPGMVRVEDKTPPLDPQMARTRQIGLEKLDKARLEIRAGNYPLARRIAEEAFNPAYGVQQEASNVLRTIDAEEHLVQVTTAQKNFDAGMEAYLRKDYGRAQKIWEVVDMKLLNPDKRRQLSEMLAMPEVRGSGVVQTGHSVPAGQVAKVPGKASVGDVNDSPFKSYTAMEEIHAQKLRNNALAAMDEALKLVQEKQTQKAVDLLKDFQAQLNEAPISPDLKLPIRRNVDQKLQQYSTLLAQQQLLEQQRASLGTNAETQRQLKTQKKLNDVEKLMSEANQLYKEGRYDQALSKAKLANELDRDNPTIGFFIGQTQTKIEGERWDQNKKNRDDQFVEAVSNDSGPNVTSRNPLHIDPKAYERSIKRKPGEPISWQTKDPVERRIERKLEEPITVHWKDKTLAQAIDDLRALSGENVEPETRALREAGVSLDMPITDRSLENIKLRSVLNILLGDAKLTYVIKHQSLQITTEDRARDKKTKMVIHPVADLIVPVENHPLPEVQNFSSALMRHINQTGGINYGGVMPYNPPYSLQQGVPVGGSQSMMSNSQLAQANAFAPGQPGLPRNAPNTLETVLIDLIKTTVAQGSWDDLGGAGKIQYYPVGMALVVNQTIEVQEEVAALLQALRRLQDLEVAIEMRLVNVSEAFFEKMGVDFDINIKTPHSRYESNLISGQFTPFGNVNRNLGVQGVVSGLTPAGTLTPDLNIPIKASSYDFSVPPFGGFPGTIGQTGGLSLGLAFLNDIQVFMFMEAAQGDRRTNVMQAPKITVFNGQTAFLSITDQQFFLTGVQLAVPSNGNQLFFVPVQQPFPLGVSMTVTPVVSADRRFVRIELTPTLTNLASATVPLIPVQIPVPQFFDGPGNNSSTNTQPQIFQMFFQQPTFTTISMGTTVRVPDGGTVLLGGLKTLSEARNEHGPPILSKIPYISRLFRNIGYGREAQSLMIMVTPRIIINEEEELIHLGELPVIPRP
jgi:Flp pilus assembly secretin CpaC